MAAEPYKPAADTLPHAIANLTYDQMQQIRFRPEAALWSTDKLKFRIRLFHLGLFNKTPVAVYEVTDGMARRLAYDPALFEFGKSGVDSSALPADLGFAGFQLFSNTDWRRDVAAFQGASYFRAVGQAKQYGLSARGLAIDCGLNRPEEFPRFSAFWLERPAAESDRVTVYALLDSPSVTGAYRFVIAPGESLTMDIDAAMFPRASIEEFGVAPLTSMFLVGENDRRVSNDFRPEIHDSDGLSMHTGAGEWIWRPLVNPASVHMSSFTDDHPRGFGLVHRDRAADHYQDPVAHYEQRPSAWIEPTGAGWGKGEVRLVEIPTADETFDNIVAFWTPAQKPKRGDELGFAYRLSWGTTAPEPRDLAIVKATRTGIGGRVGQKRTHYAEKFVVDFAGGGLSSLDEQLPVEPVVTASRGRVELVSTGPLEMIHGWRAMFDLAPTDDGADPIDIRLYLRLTGKPLSEAWLYQWTPPTSAERKF